MENTFDGSIQVDVKSGYVKFTGSSSTVVVTYNVDVGIVDVVDVGITLPEIFA
jgi:hypothetical protein